MLNYRPNNILINAKIHVDENITHTTDLAPRNFRMETSVVLWNSSCRFANDLQMMNNPGLN
jgi:hypothetical protein